MAVNFTLLEEGRIEYFVFSEPWTIQDLMLLRAQRKQYLDEAAYKVHTLVDVRHIKKIPPGLIPYACKSPIISHNNTGYTAIVGASRLVRSVSELVCRSVGYHRIIFFETEADALEFLRQHISQEPPVDPRSLQ